MLLGSVIYLKASQNSQKHYTYDDSVITVKGSKSKPEKNKRCIGQGLGGVPM